MDAFQTLLDLLLNPNAVYLILIGGLWAVALALVIPGTGVAELLAAVCLGLAGLGMARLEVNPWAALALVAGLALFVVEFRWPRRGVFLAASGLTIALGSIFLFRRGADGGVSPLLAAAATLLTVGYFWIALRKALAAQLAPPKMEMPVPGARGEARTALDPEGTVYVEGELWTAESEAPVAAGEPVVVQARHGLRLKVKKA